MAVEHVTTHVEDALSGLITQYKDKPRLAALLSAYIRQVQKVEDVFNELATLRFLDTAVGDQLDKLGELVGEERQGRDDELFRVYILARIRTNRSFGTPNDILEILTVIGADLDSPPLTENQASFLVYLASLESSNGEDLDPHALVDILKRAKPAGVRMGLVAPPPGVESESSFAFSHEGEPSDPARGFGHVGSTDFGGVLSSLYE